MRVDTLFYEVPQKLSYNTIYGKNNKKINQLSSIYLSFTVIFKSVANSIPAIGTKEISISIEAMCLLTDLT